MSVRTPMGFLMRVIALALSLIVLIGNAGATSVQRLHSVRDLVGTTVLAAEVVVSPDGHWAAFVTRAGNLSANDVESSLYLVDRVAWHDAILRGGDMPSVDELYRVQTTDFSHSDAPLSHLVWSRDSSRIFFTARSTETHNIEQVFHVDLATRSARKRTDAPFPVTAFAVAELGDTLVYCGDVPDESTADPDHGLVVQERSAWQMVGTVPSATLRCYRSVAGRSNELTDMVWLGDWPSISPDGRWLIYLERVGPGNFQNDWREYRNLEPALITAPWAGPPTARRLMLQDMRTGSRSALIDAPLNAGLTGVLGSRPKPWITWAPNSRQVIVAGTFAPLAHVRGGERVRRQSSLAAFEVDIGTRRATEIQPVSSSGGIAVEWSLGEQLGVRDENLVTTYHRENQRWANPSATPYDPYLVIQLDVAQTAPATADGYTSPQRPDVWASVGTRRARLLELNPSLRDVQFAEQQPFEWIDRLGRHFSGTLVVPLGYSANRRYPLAIGINAGPDALSPAFPVQPIVDRQMIFLAATCGNPAWSEQYLPTLPYNEGFSVCLDGAIETLTQNGIVDTGRVGLLGFSYSGNPVQYAVTASDHVYAAASIVDSIQATPMSYALQWNSDPWQWRMAQFDDPATTLSFHAQSYYSGPPFGPSLEEWFEQSPAFILDRVYTPVRYESHTSNGLAFWDTYVTLRRQHRPAEMVLYPTGSHDLNGPVQFQTSAQAIVDWFDFWLNDHERTDPYSGTPETEASLADQYMRWRELRAERDAVRAQARPPLRDWSWRPRVAREGQAPVDQQQPSQR